jgi:hypothetical protein
LLLLQESCSKKNNSSVANNIEFNKKYKSQEKISPIGNIVSRRQNEALLEKNYRYYLQKHSKEQGQYHKNREYMEFLAKNDVHTIKNIEVETIPKENYKYIKQTKDTNSLRELNRVAYTEIEYVMFINQALFEKQQYQENGDPIIYPYVYDRIPRNDRHIVMGDEYHKWNSWCEVNGVC